FLYALDAASGKFLWKYETGEKILGGPNFVRLRPQATSPGSPSPRPSPQGEGETSRTFVIVGSYDFRLHCLDAETGKTNWVYETGNYINGTPAVADNQTVFGGCDALLHVISLSTGQQTKEIEAGAYVAGSVALADGRAYF